MKKFPLTMLACLSAVCVLAQGTVAFVNLNAGAGLNAPVYMSDGVTKLVGPNYVAQLLYSATAGGTMAFAGSPAPFFTGGGAGYFNGGTTVLPGIAGGATAFCLVVAWDTTLGGTTTGATEAQALAYFQAGHANVWFESNFNYWTWTAYPFAVVTGNPTATPPGVPAALVGMNWVGVPEPPPLALAGLAAAALLGFRRPGRLPS